MANSPDILIIGGGVVGLTVAYVFAREGLRVTVVDRKEFGQEASWAGAGIIPPGDPQHAVSPFDRLRSLSSVQFPGLSAELRELTGINNGYVRCGGLEFAAEENGGRPEEWRGAGIEVQAVTEARTRELEPALAPGLGAAYRLPQLAQVRNPRHLKALIAACDRLKVKLCPHAPVQALLAQGKRIQGVRGAQDTFQADVYIVATGAWTDPLLAGIGRRLDIRPVRGQIALLNPSAPLFRHVLLWGDHYLVPRQDGRVLAGSTEEHVGYDTRTTAAAQRDLLALACRLVPDLAQAALERSWAGLRPGSPDGLPFLGPVPGYDNLFVAAGHFRAGIQLSPGTAQLLKEMILGRPLTVPAEPFRLDRKSTPG
jgi:glycine oxidase